MPSDRIDTHFHMIPPFWAKAMTEKVGQPLWGTPDWSFDSALRLMDRLGTDVGIISLAAPSVSVWSGQEQVDMARRVNDFGVGLRERSGGRLGYFATLPMPDPEASVTEICRAYDDYEADGVLLLSSYKGTYLGDDAFRPMWEELERRKAVVFLHPGSPELKPLEGVPQPTVDFPMDTTRCALNLVTSGVLARCPSVKIILSHAGGFLPYAGRRFSVLLHDYTMKDSSEDEITVMLKRFYFDTALTARDALPTLLAFAAPGHVVFGSDNPYISADTQAMFTQELDDFSSQELSALAAINRGSAEELFPRLKR